ncbi:MAG: twin transmembrane helix small protein [Hasllibacter sp.]
MAKDPFTVIALLAAVGVLIILMVGVGGFARGGEFNRKYANKIMRLRIIAQFGAVVLLLFALWMRSA